MTPCLVSEKLTAKPHSTLRNSLTPPNPIINKHRTMDTGSSSSPHPLRRVPSFLLRFRHRADEGPSNTVSCPTHSARRDERSLARVKESAVFVDDMDCTNPKAVHQGSTLQISSARKPRASFSGLSHVVRTFPKRIASHRRKNSVIADRVSLCDYNYDFPDIFSRDEKLMHASSAWDTIDPPPQLKAHGWLRRCMSTRFRPRRQTADTPSRPAIAQWAHQNFHSPIPTSASVVPSFLDDHSSGAAARAAAAEENEMRRYRWLHRLRSMEQGVRGDSESGIGLEEVQTGMRENSLARLGKRHQYI